MATALQHFNRIRLNGVFGRKMFYSSAERVDESNVIKLLNMGLSYHSFNQQEIDYLEQYYSGNQPILYREKQVRPEINNKIVENFAFDAVGFHTSQDFGEPIKYVASSIEQEDKSEDINKLNNFMRVEDKAYWDIELGTWQNICGTAYRIILPNKDWTEDSGEAPFVLDVLDPKTAFVIYSSRVGKKPLMGVRIFEEEDENGSYQLYECYTKSQRFRISRGKIIQKTTNPLGRIPIVEYPKNSRRLGAIELTISLTDAINSMGSNRMDGIEQFVQAFMKFVNCEIDEDKFLKMCSLGAIKVKGEPGLPADVDMVATQLDQSNTQISKDDLYKSFLIVQGMPSREQNTGGDTGSAVYLRNGWDFAEKRTEIGEPIIKKSEREFLALALKILAIKTGMALTVSDLEIQIVRNKTDNMLVKAQALQILLACGVDEETALTIIELFSDPQKVYTKSKDRMEKIYDQSGKDTDVSTTDGGKEPAKDVGKDNKDITVN